MRRGRSTLGSASGGFAFTNTSPGSSLSYIVEPPSFTAVSDPSVVVYFKNALKKDSTTKAKGLEDLLQYAQAHPFEKDSGVEESLLVVWTQIYARLSIDNSRRVRELSHTLQLELLRSARKRMERHVPSVVGPWLAGIYDRDRVVAKAANEGLSSFLTTPEKLTAFWTKCQSQILDFATEAIRETEDTLSDERSTTVEDSQAKYFRVVTASLSLMLGLLQRVDDAGMQKFTTKYDEFFAVDTVWRSITFSDATVRKAVCHLLFACLDRQLPYATTKQARQAFVTGGLRTAQSGSALEYVRALTKLSHQDASCWSPSPTDKKPPLARLLSFIEKGSQGSPPKFWQALDQLLTLIPATSLEVDIVSKLLSSIKMGITHREEPRTNTSYSWKCYIDVAKRSLVQLPIEAQLVLAKEHLLPLFEQFMFSLSDTSAIPTGPNAMSILVEAHLVILCSSSEVVQASAQAWNRLSSILSTNMSSSLPEVSKEYETSQNKIAEQGRRWFGLIGQIFTKIQGTDPRPPDQTTEPSNQILLQCFSLLENRNMKPFGVARIIEHSLSTSQHLFVENRHPLETFLLTAANEHFNKLAQSRSASSLMACLAIFGSIQNKCETYQKIWQTWTEKAIQLPVEKEKIAVLTGLLSHERASSVAKADDDLQKTLYEDAIATIADGPEAWDMLEASIAHGTMGDDVSCRLASELVDRLSRVPKNATRSQPLLRMIEMIARSRPSAFASGSIRTDLVSQLLSLSEISDSSVSGKVSAIRSVLDSQYQGKLPVVDVIRSNLETAGAQSLGVGTLLSQARSALDTGVALLEDLLPNTKIWTNQLSPLLESPLSPSLSITNDIGGAIIISNQHEPTGGTVSPMARDRDGLSIPARMASYTSSLIRDYFSKLQPPSRQLQVELLYLQNLSAQLASDQIALMSQNGLWMSLEHADAVSEASDMVTLSKALLHDLARDATEWANSGSEEAHASPVIIGLVDVAVRESRDMSPRGAYSARILSELLRAIVDSHGLFSSIEEQFLNPEILKAKPDTFLLAAGAITGFGDAARSSKALSHFCNKLVSDVAALPLDKAHLTLVLLGLVAQVYEVGQLPIVNNRVVFAVKQITSWLDDADKLDATIAAPICCVLNFLLPCMKDVYGSYWEGALMFIRDLWRRIGKSELSEALPFIHASLRLVKTLENVTEPNDDLDDALKDFAAVKAACLIELLKIDRTHDSQPTRIVDGMLCREAERLPVSRLPASEELFFLIASGSREIQTVAFSLLHKKIPAEQGQKSIDVLLDKTDARLPEELLSLFLEPPTLEKYTDEILSGFPTSVRSYLLSWKLVFDAYGSSQFKVRDDYTEQLKREGMLSPLLDFMFDVLGHSAAHPLNLDREKLAIEQICDWDVKLAEAESGEHSLHWLLVHLYYLTLKFVPGLFKNWYINCRSKQTRIAVESWSTKYFSPIVIREALDRVEAWAQEQQSSAAEEKELLVKVSRPAREVTAGYEVDESQAAIVIKVPPSYPIENITVTSLHRVAVTERKWQSWIMTTQGAITLYNGDIIDGLQVFKRNIAAALDGQSECAICYSVISTDKRMPDKRCSTCSHLFHRTCLYKWFQTSNQNSCPLCRNPIDYLGADTARRRQG